MLSNPVDKDEAASASSNVASPFGRSVALREDATAGTVLSEDLLIGKKPAGGIPMERASELVGRKLACDVPATRLLRDSDLQ